MDLCIGAMESEKNGQRSAKCPYLITVTQPSSCWRLGGRRWLLIDSTMADCLCPSSHIQNSRRITGVLFHDCTCSMLHISGGGGAKSPGQAFPGTHRPPAISHGWTPACSCTARYYLALFSKLDDITKLLHATNYPTKKLP